MLFDLDFSVIREQIETGAYFTSQMFFIPGSDFLSHVYTTTKNSGSVMIKSD